MSSSLCTVTLSTFMLKYGETSLEIKYLKMISKDLHRILDPLILEILKNQ